MNFLERIITQKRREVEESRGAAGEKELLDRIRELGSPKATGHRGPFADALANGPDPGRADPGSADPGSTDPRLADPGPAGRTGARTSISVIAEIKKASPSRGLIRQDFDPETIARSYEKAGAAAISVLTDQTFFGGSLQDLTMVRRAVSIPVLRKDFIVDRYQLLESRVAGADAVLLIAAVLGQELAEFLEMSRSLGLEVLVETHTEEEVLLALASGAPIIGINNRDLKTFEVNLRTTLDLAPLVPTDRVLVSESGIRDKQDLIRLAGAGVRAVLVGETLMRAEDPGQKLKELVDPEMPWV